MAPANPDNRFALLQHEPPPAGEGGRPRHWDLLLEQQGVLKTWALAERPCLELTIAAEALADHRLMYLDFEGPLDADRGTVLREDAGTWLQVAQHRQHWEFELRGDWLRGRFWLRQQAHARWEFRWQTMVCSSSPVGGQ